jgi:D-tagatose-1,6-bisphosphate aldolase subunit GatZ/KbaZ
MLRARAGLPMPRGVGLAMADVLRRVIAANRAHGHAAIPSVCSAHPDVLLASLRLAAQLNRPVVIEATSNQVNQDGGYTGLRPADFVALVRGMAQAAGCAPENVILGGDHLGPQVWRKGNATHAMAKARVMVAGYVQAGFTKIHLDCSEGCAGEAAQVGDAIAAARAADLACAALQAAPNPAALLFVVGTEVPPPGGARVGDHGDIAPTTPAAALATMQAHLAAFDAAGLGAACAQIGGLVVQPGVEFSPMQVHHLPLTHDPGYGPVLARYPGLCLEAHSTDYQHPAAYQRLANLGFAFQKVGPALTHAYRRAVYALGHLRQIAGGTRAPAIWDVMEELMLQNPGHWQAHYHGAAASLRIQRHGALADRIRYYWPLPQAQAAVTALLDDLNAHPLPDPLVAQGFDAPTIARAQALGGPLPMALIHAEIQAALRPYFIDSQARISAGPAP